MIKANELRIGNILKHKRGESFVVTGSILAIMDLKNDLSAILPIYLSEEILLKLGFISHKRKGICQKYVLFVLGDFSYNTLSDKFYILDRGDWFIQPKYVHQLQNLYFALTGQELNTSGLINTNKT